MSTDCTISVDPFNGNVSVRYERFHPSPWCRGSRIFTLTSEDLEVEVIEPEGTDYYYLHVDDLIELLRRSGYTVTPPSQVTSE